MQLSRRMTTPEESFETVVDGSREAEARTDAIEQLATANECDRLEDLVRSADLDEQYREKALTSLANPQCKSTLEQLVDHEEIPETMQDKAETLLQETADDAGAGP